jgi:hypothetical protein
MVKKYIDFSLSITKPKDLCSFCKSSLKMLINTKKIYERFGDVLSMITAQRMLPIKLRT